ncbi:MAG: oligosaccharide flippase family protein [Lachnospiraceae bacterium]|nr:oligosaccharide flippase family protein [Lachnospiraceae bacterium]
MKIERTKNAVRGTITGIIAKVTQLLFPFIIRTIFIKTLGIEYLGLNSLFSSILQVLNLAELGVSSALVFSMYKPIADDDRDKICELMNLYRFYYRIIGTIILSFGILLIPFIPHLIKGDVPPDINIYIIYLMNLIATVLSYWLFAYRSALFSAHQRLDITNIFSFIISIFTNTIQIICLLLYKNYYLYLVINILSQIVLNLCVAIASKKVYPMYVPVGKIPKNEQKAINAKVRDLFTAKIGVVVNTSADALVISSFLGLKIGAIYHNYYYIVTSVMAFFDIFFAACTAGIGNSIVLNERRTNRNLLYNLNHILFFALNICCSCLVCLYQPFMKMWVGNKYTLSFDYVILFAVYLFVEEGPRTMLNFKDASGIWKEDRFRPLITAITNLILNLILVNYIGLYGVLLSTIISFGIIAFPWLVINIDKYLFELDIVKYLFSYFSYALITILSSTISYQLCKTFDVYTKSAVIGLFFRFVSCVIVSITVFELFFWRKEENSYMLRVVRRIIKK